MSTAANRQLDYMVLWPLSMTFLLVAVLLYYQSWLTALDCPYSLSREGPALWAGMEMSQGLNPYQVERLAAAPWQVIVQPPVYYYLLGWFFIITGPVFYPMRMVSMFCFILTLIYSYRIFALSGASQLGRLIGLCVYLFSWVIWEHSFQGRSDMLALVFGLLAVHQYLLLARKRNVDSFWRLPRLIVIATLCTLAIFTRQAMILIVPAITAALIIGRQWRLSLVFMGLCAFLSGASLLILNKVTAGGLLANLTFPAGSHFSWSAYQAHLAWLGSDWLIIAMGPLALVSLFWSYFQEPDSHGRAFRISFSVLVLLTFWLLLSLILIFYSLGLQHAAVDQSILALFAVAWLVALAADHWKRRYLLFVFLVVAISAYVQADLSRLMVNSAQTMNGARTFFKTNYDAIVPRRILSEDCSIAIDIEAQSEFIDLPAFLQVWESHPQEYARRMAEIKERIENQQYGALVINSQDGCLLTPKLYWEPAIIGAVKAHYKPVYSFINEGRSHDIYLPRK